MAPVLLPRLPSAERLLPFSSSISSTFSSTPATTKEGDIPEDVYAAIHRSIPLIPRAIRHVSNLLPHSPSPDLTSIALQKRQTQILAIPTTYAGLNDGPAPGSVAGIVIGAVGGFLLILWLLYTCFNMGGFPGSRGGEVVEEEIVRHRSRSPRRSHSRSETIEVTKSRSPPRRQRERIVVEETRRVSRPPEPEPEDPIDDIVEVIEEHSASTPPRRTSKRSGGFRTVDPAEYGGGGRPMRKVR